MVDTHTKYSNIEDLKTELSVLYNKLTSINDGTFKSLVTVFMYDPLSTPNYIPNDEGNTQYLTTAISSDNVDTYKSGVPDFMNLLKDALYCQIEPNVIGDGSILDNNNKMKGLLKFVKGDTLAITRDTVKVGAEIKVARNIISSVNVINAFLSILESYMDYIKDDSTSAQYDINNIFIVNDDPTSSKNYKYSEASTTSADSLEPRFRALYLKLATNIYTSLVESTSIEVDTRYDGISYPRKITSRTKTGATIFTGEKLDLKENNIGYVRGIRIRKINGNSIIDEMTADADDSPLLDERGIILNFEVDKMIMDEKNATPHYGPNLKKRDIYLLKHFLNLVFNIKKESRFSSIKILQTYYTVMKILLLTAINTGNHLYNSKFERVAVVHAAANTLFGLKGIDVNDFSASTLYTSDVIVRVFKIDTNYGDIVSYDTTLNTCINDLIQKITIESANSIGVGTTLPTLSNGFYAKKLDDNHIEISEITIPATVPAGSYVLNGWYSTDSFKTTAISGNAALDNSIKNDFSNLRIDNIKNKYKININNGRYNIVEIYKDGVDKYKYKIEASLDDPNLYPQSSNTFDTTKYRILSDDTNTYSALDNQEYINKAEYVIFKQDSSGGSSLTNQVKLVEITPQDNAEEYNNLKTEIMGYSENIKLNKSKINNNTTLYDLHKSKYNLLNTQLITYYVIIGVLIGIIVAINLANIEKSFIKMIATGCFGAVILLYISYYIMNVVYINEEFTVEHFISAFTAQEPASITDEYSPNYTDDKKAFVEGRMDNYCEAIILALKILTPSLENSSLINTSSELLRIGKNESKQRLYINNILINKRDNSEISIDVLKYENMNFAVHIKALLITATILIGVYTLHLYIDRKYLDLLIFITSILLICVFTYFIVYSNKIVRTTSSNNYWGKEYEVQYT